MFGTNKDGKCFTEKGDYSRTSSTTAKTLPENVTSFN